MYMRPSFLRMGFESTLVLNCDIDDFLRATRGFVNSLLPEDIGFFYFAGHGTEASVLQRGRHTSSNCRSTEMTCLVLRSMRTTSLQTWRPGKRVSMRSCSTVAETTRCPREIARRWAVASPLWTQRAHS